MIGHRGAAWEGKGFELGAFIKIFGAVLVYRASCFQERCVRRFDNRVDGRRSRWQGRA